MGRSIFFMGVGDGVDFEIEYPDQVELKIYKKM